MTTTNDKAQINIDQFLTLSVNTVHSYFFKAPKEKSRRLYKDIAGGEVVNVATLTVGEDKGSEVKLSLSLDRSEYKGHLTFHLFNKALEMMLRNIADKIQAKQDLNIFTSEETGEAIIHIPGLVEDRGNLNVLVLGIAPSKRGATIKLQFLDSDQFREAENDDDILDASKNIDN